MLATDIDAPLAVGATDANATLANRREYCVAVAVVEERATGAGILKYLDGLCLFSGIIICHG